MSDINFREIKNKLNKIERHIENEKWPCLHPDCQASAINSHLLQRNGILNNVAENGHLCEMRKPNVYERENYELVDDDRKPLADLPVYVNVRNERRYFRSTPIKDALSENRRDWPIHLKISLRKQKALHLYHLIREYKLFDWWD